MYKGVSIGVNTYNAALTQTNNNIPKAQGLIRATIDSLAKQRDTLATVQSQQARVNKFLSDSIVITTKRTTAQNSSNASSAAAAKQYDLTSQHVDAYSAALGINFVRLSKSAYYEQQAEAGLRRFVGAMVNANTTLTGWISAVATYQASAKTAADRSQLLGAALVSFNGAAISYQTSINNMSVANRQLVSDFKNVHAGVVNVAQGSIDFHRAGAAPLLADLQNIQTAAQGAAEQMYQNEVSTKGATQASADAANLYRSQTYGTLVDEAKRLGFTSQAAHNLAKEYFGIPKDVVTRIKQLGGDQTNHLLNALGKQLSYLTGHPWHIGVHLDVLRPDPGNLQSVINQQVPPQARKIIYGSARGNASVPDGVSAVGENGRELLVKHGPHLAVVPNGPTEAFLRETGAQIRGFAKGTQSSILALASQYRDWNPSLMAAIAEAESSGNAHAHNYNLATGDDSYGLWQINMLGSLGPGRRREFGISDNTALYNPSVNVRAAHDIWRGSGYGAWSTYNSGAYLQYLGDGGSIHNGGSGSGGSLTPEQQRRRHLHYRQQQLAQAHTAAVGNLPGDLRNFEHSLGSVSSEKSAFGQLIADARGAGLSQSFIAGLRTDNAALDAEIRKTSREVNQLHADVAKLHAERQQFRQERATVAAAVRGSFDITSAGANASGRVSFGRIEAQAKQEAAIVEKWGQGLRKLGRGPFGHSPAGKAMLRRLFETGPSTLPQVEALDHASRGELRSLLSSVGEIDAAGRSLGQYEARNLYGGAIRREERLVRRDRRQVARDHRTEQHFEDAIMRAIIRAAKHVDIKQDPRGVARLVLTGEKLLQRDGHRVKR